MDPQWVEVDTSARGLKPSPIDLFRHHPVARSVREEEHSGPSDADLGECRLFKSLLVPCQATFATPSTGHLVRRGCDDDTRQHFLTDNASHVFGLVRTLDQASRSWSTPPECS